MCSAACHVRPAKAIGPLTPPDGYVRARYGPRACRRFCRRLSDKALSLHRPRTRFGAPVGGIFLVVQKPRPRRLQRPQHRQRSRPSLRLAPEVPSLVAQYWSNRHCSFLWLVTKFSLTQKNARISDSRTRLQARSGAQLLRTMRRAKQGLMCFLRS